MPLNIEQTKRLMIEGGSQRYVPFMDFVDEFRRSSYPEASVKPRPLDHARYDALLASTAEYLCDERGVDPPAWLWDVPCLAEPWFVSGIENLKATGIAESPAHFRRRQIFELENFLSRV